MSEYEDTPGDRRFIIGAIAFAALMAIVLGVFVLGDGQPEPAEPVPVTNEYKYSGTDRPHRIECPDGQVYVVEGGSGVVDCVRGTVTVSLQKERDRG